MAPKKSKDFLKELNPFSFGLPQSGALFIILLIMSLITGISATALFNRSSIDTSYIMVNGSIVGILIIMLPALLTIIIVKAAKRYINTKYIFFVSLIGAFSYSMFILLAGISYIIGHSYATAVVIIIVGDASIFGWWFFASKMLMQNKKRDVLFAFIQPTLNILLYAPYSARIISFGTPFSTLLLKLYAGILIFLVVSYMIIFVVDRPYKKNFGFHPFEAFSQLLQNWLFDVNTAAPFGTKFGRPMDIQTDTITMRRPDGTVKCVFFAPDIHYGPAGTLGGSDFPHMLELHIARKYSATAFILHKAVDMDHNPTSNSQFAQIRDTLDLGVKEGRQLKGKLSYTYNSYKTVHVSRLDVGGASLVTLTRAPRVTEDVSPSIALLFSEIMESRFGPSVLVDAHNSRLESQPKDELNGVKFGSAIAAEYAEAMKTMGLPGHSSKNMRVGVSSTEIYHRLGAPEDIAEGNLNIAVFSFNGFKYAMVYMNANNMLPALRNRIIKHLKEKYRLHAEVYTTDTHAVNSLGFEADNVVGRKTSFERIIKPIDQGIEAALADVEKVSVTHSRNVMKKFMVWGPNSMDSIITIAKSVYDFTRIVVSVIVVFGFIIAAWVISVI